LNKIVIHCNNIIKTFGTGESQVLALRGVDLDVYKGELLMLVCPSRLPLLFTTLLPRNEAET